MQLIMPVPRFFLEQRLKLADAGLAKVKDVHRRRRSAQLYDSRFKKSTRKVALRTTSCYCMRHTASTYEMAGKNSMLRWPSKFE
jgi:hypothetical protein